MKQKWQLEHAQLLGPRALWFRWILGEFWYVIHTSSPAAVYARLRYGQEYSGDWIVSSPRRAELLHCNRFSRWPGVKGAILNGSNMAHGGTFVCIHSLLSAIWIYEYGIDMDVEINMDMDMTWYRVAFAQTLGTCSEWYCLDSIAQGIFLQEFASCSVWALWCLFGKRSGYSDEQDGCSP